MNGIRLKSVVMAGALVAFAAVTAQANTITPRFFSFTPGAEIVYHADVTSASLRAGDGFTIYDIGGFEGFGLVHASWTPTSSAFGSPWGPAPLGLATPDAFHTNVHFTYNGPTITIVGGVLYSPFTVLTRGTALFVDDWVSRDHTLLGTQLTVQGTIVVPTATVVPEPGSTIAFLGLGLLAVGTLRRRILG